VVGEKNEEGNKKYWVQPYFNRDSEQGCFIAARQLDQTARTMTLDRIPVRARFFALVLTGPGAHPASYTISIRSLYRG